MMSYQPGSIKVLEKDPSYTKTSPREVEAATKDSVLRCNDNVSSKAAAWQPARPIDRKSEQKRPQQRYAYLDGLRGFAALLVYVLHYQVLTHPVPQAAILENGFGFGGRYHFAAFPGIRLFFSGGHLGVAVFFIISGYVLASSPLRSIHAKNSNKLVDTISSALFRRWFRLYIPLAGTTFLWMATWHLTGMKTLQVQEKNFMDELFTWYCQLKNSSFIFSDNYFNTYNFHLWSIPLEFRGSIVIYTVVLALRRVPSAKRLCCEAILAWYFVYVSDAWYCGLFMMGMLLCDIDLLAESKELPRIFTYLKSFGGWIYPILLIIGLYLGGVPSVSEHISHLRTTPGWYYLSFLKPQAMWDFRWFFRFWAATLVMISVPRLSRLRSFFETRFCQYLGKISYGFYLVHGPVMWSIGIRLYAVSGMILDHHAHVIVGWANLLPLSNRGPLGLEFSFLAPQLVLFPLTLLAADIVTKLLDEPSIRFSQWLWTSAIDGSEPRKKEGSEYLV